MIFEKMPPNVPDQEREITPEEKTHLALADLQQLHNSLIKHLKKYKIPNQEKQSGAGQHRMEQGKDAITFDRFDSGTMVISDQRTLENGTEDELIYQITAPQDNQQKFSADLPGNIILKERKGENVVKSVFRFKVGENEAKMENVRNSRVLGVEKDGVHVPSSEQLIWDHAWSDFMAQLYEDKKFSDFLEREASQKDNPIVKRWATDLMHGRIKVEKAETFLEEMRDYWKIARGNSRGFPKAPFETGNRPEDGKYYHRHIQEIIDNLSKRLKETVQRLDQALYKEPHPYR